MLLAFALRSPRTRALLRRFAVLPIAVALVCFGLLVAVQLGELTMDLTWYFSLIAVFYTIVLWGILESPPRATSALRSRWLVYTVAVSYSLYMYHQLVNGLLHGIVFGSAPIIDSWARVALTVLSVACTYGLAHLSLRYVENPIRAYGRPFRFQARVAPAAPVAQASVAQGATTLVRE